jgi:hypothetical protein
MFTFKTTLFSLAIAFVSASAFAADIDTDLEIPFEPLTNPFGRSATHALPASISSQVKAILESCAYVPSSGGGSVLGEAQLRKGNCSKSISAIYERDKNGQPVIGHRVQLTVNGFDLDVISWDGNDSDGGDEQAIGVYDTDGHRIAAYTGLFTDGNVIDGLAHAVNARLPEVTQ